MDADLGVILSRGQADSGSDGPSVSTGDQSASSSTAVEFVKVYTRLRELQAAVNTTLDRHEAVQARTAQLKREMQPPVEGQTGLSVKRDNLDVKKGDTTNVQDGPGPNGTRSSDPVVKKRPNRINESKNGDGATDKDMPDLT